MTRPTHTADGLSMVQVSWKLRRELGCTSEEAREAIGFFGADYEACRDFIRPPPPPPPEPRPWLEAVFTQRGVPVPSSPRRRP